MKRLFGMLIIVAAGTAGAVSMPKKINFQGKLVDPATHNPKNGTVSMTFSIYTSPSGGAAIYTETQNVSVNNGVFSVQIGTSVALNADLFAQTSTYLGVAVSPDAEMTPRQQFVMSPYAFTAAALMRGKDISINPGFSYSTFTADGNLLIDAGVVATTMTLSGLAADPTGSSGMFYFNSSSGALKVYNSDWRFLYGQAPRLFAVTTDNTAATAAKAAAATILIAPLQLNGPILVNFMKARVTTALGAAGDIGVYDSGGNLLLNGGSSSLTTTAGAKSVAPAQTGAARFLGPGLYYLALTWNSTTGVVGGDGLGVAGLIPQAGTLAAGGGLVLPATITPSSIVNGTSLYFVALSQQ